MTTVRSEYQGNLRVESTHVQSGTTIITDAPTDNGGQGRSFSPTDLAATALGTCALTIMGLYAEGHNLDIKGATMDIIKKMSPSPRRIAGIDVTFTMPANNFSDKDKTALENAAYTCPVHKSLGADVEQNFKFVWL